MKLCKPLNVTFNDDGEDKWGHRKSTQRIGYSTPSPLWNEL